MSEYTGPAGQCYDDVLAQIKKINVPKVVVTGPQRSGTRFASKVLAADINYRFVDEKDFSMQDWGKFKAMLSDGDQCIYHAPALSFAAHLFGSKPDVAVVYMCRNTKDIIASEDRINWRTEFDGLNLIVEEKKYSQFMQFFKVDDPISVKKYKTLSSMQRHFIQNLILLNYESMKIQPTWKDKKNRKNHLWDETE